jgi:hypothetical protein
VDGQERRLTPQPSSDADGWRIKPRRRRCSWRRPHIRSAATIEPPRDTCGDHRWRWPPRLILLVSLPSKL